MPLRLKLLGGATIENEQGPLRGRAAHRRRLALLALLAASPRGMLGREKLIGYLWPDSPEASARHLLSESLYVLRRELDDEVFLTPGDEIGLNPACLSCDLTEFRSAIVAREWSRAVGIYAGPFLDGFYVDEAREFTEWADAEREAVRRDYGKALETLAEREAESGELVRAAEWWGRLAAEDPYNSRIVLRLMGALAGSGDRARALQVAAQHAARLSDDLGIQPDPAVAALAERLRTEVAEPRAPQPSRSAPARTGQSPATDSPFPPDLELIRPLGEGSVAIVYLARESSLGRLVAIKLLAPRFSDDETTRLRFEREAQVAARILHPNVTPVYRIGRTEDGAPYIVYPYIAGGSLEDRLAAAGRMEIADARRYIGQVAAGLIAAHRLGVVHRDVRPANVLFDREMDRVLITDFGLAAVLETGQQRAMRLTMPGERLGNPAYASPEQLRGDTVTDRSDVYSLGVLAFELLTARLPYDSTSLSERILASTQQEPRRVSEFREEVDPELESLIHRCLNKRPEHRPFATDIVEALGSA